MMDVTLAADTTNGLRLENDQLRHKIDLLLRLQRYSYELAGEQNLDRLLQLFVDSSKELVNTQAASLLLLDELTGELVFVLTRGEKDELLRYRRLRPGEGLVGWSVTNGQPAVVNDVSSDPRFSATMDQITKFSTRSLAVVPLIVRNRTIGAIEVVNKLATDANGRQILDTAGFTNEDMDTLLALAGQAAVAIDRTRLLQYMADEQRRLVSAQEEVRRKIHRDLHDGPAQRLMAMSMNIKFILQLLERMPERVPNELLELDNLAIRTSREIRTLLFELRPIVLQTQGLIPALEQYVERIRTDGMTVHFLADPAIYAAQQGMSKGLPVVSDSHWIDPDVEATVFAIVQEAVNNCKKHAHAQALTIEVNRDGDYLLASVQDDGRGFNIAEVERTYDQRNSFGLLTMRERAELVQGQCEIHSEPGRGTTVMIRVPVQLPEPQRATNVLTTFPGKVG